MSLPSADVAAMFTADEFHSRLLTTAHDTEAFARQLGYLVAEWPLEERELCPAFNALQATIEECAVLAKRLRGKAEEA